MVGFYSAMRLTVLSLLWLLQEAQHYRLHGLVQKLGAPEQVPTIAA